jgi:hypothetical protein
MQRPGGGEFFCVSTRFFARRTRFPRCRHAFSGSRGLDLSMSGRRSRVLRLVHHRSDMGP